MLNGWFNGYPLAGLALDVAFLVLLWRAGRRSGEDQSRTGRIIRWVAPPVMAAIGAWFFTKGSTGWAEIAAITVVVVRAGNSGWNRYRKDGDPGPGRPAGLPAAPRTAGFLCAFAGFFAVAAVIPLQDLLGAWLAVGWGLVALVIADGGSAFGIYWEWYHLQGYHQALTSVCCFIAGICGFATYALWDRMMREGAKIIPKTGVALNQASARIASGKAAQAAQALPGFSSGRVMIFTGIAFVAIILIFSTGIHHWIRRGHQKAGRAAQRRRDSRAQAGGQYGLPGPGSRSNRQAIG
jgi:hypothetical protein